MAEYDCTRLVVGTVWRLLLMNYRWFSVAFRAWSLGYLLAFWCQDHASPQGKAGLRAAQTLVLASAA